MGLPLQELCPELQKDPSFAAACCEIIVDAVGIDERNSRVKVRFHSERALSAREVNYVQAGLSSRFPSFDLILAARFSYENLDEQSLVYLIEELKLQGMPLNGYFKQAKYDINGEKITIDVPGGCSMLQDMGFPSSLAE
ncbi:hypothetical protein LJC49_05065, partial [Ruminococcaceae bacterium OttesenSCG-928-I18]|nr:hypothetical protein [Ruminococcaceae bacterium OttesenSCG-928-I18]